MKKNGILLIVLSLIILPILSAAPCEISVSMINQDPYPAIPGDYVKIVFQIDGIANAECGIVKFGLKESYPISLDPNATNEVVINSGTFQRKYSSFYLATYKLRIDENAIEGDNPIEVYYSSNSGAELLKEFDIYVEDTRADFEVYIKDYNYVDKILNIEILNIENVDIQALTIEIPKQDEINLKGSNRVIVGDLDSNEYTSAEFETTFPEDEADVRLKMIYTDSINVRREIEKTVHFDSSYFVDRNSKSSSGTWIYIVLALIIIWIIYRKIRKNKIKKKLREKARHQ
jgi:hypothetical protein